MVMWKFKSCPRCGGDLFIDRDLNGWFQQCLQCAFRRDLKDADTFTGRPPETGKELAGTGGSQSRKHP